MFKAAAVVSLMLASAAAGAWLPDYIAGTQAEGGEVNCIDVSGKHLCKGQPIATLPWNYERELGSLSTVWCGYKRPGSTGDNMSVGLQGLVSGCNSKRYVASLTDGAVLTNFWIDDGRIIRIDRWNANPTEF